MWHRVLALVDASLGWQCTPGLSTDENLILAQSHFPSHLGGAKDFFANPVMQIRGSPHS